MTGRRLPLDSPTRRNTVLVEQAQVRSGQRVLDVSLYGRIGHGSASLALLVKRTCPGASVTALYDDRQMLAHARREISVAGLTVDLLEGKPWAPPFPPGSFDVILSSLLFHHMSLEDQRRTLQALHALLVPRGTLHIADWAQPRSFALGILFLGVRVSDGFKNTAVQAAGRFAPLIADAGFGTVEQARNEIAIPGRMAFYRATKGDPPARSSVAQQAIRADRQPLG